MQRKDRKCINPTQVLLGQHTILYVHVQSFFLQILIVGKKKKKVGDMCLLQGFGF